MPKGVTIETTEKNIAYDREVGDFLLPVTEGLMGQWFIGGSEEFTEKNRWSRGGYGDGQLYGSPTLSSYYGSFKGGTKGMYLSFPDPTQGSWYIVVRNTDTLGVTANQPLFLGTSPGSVGANMAYNSTSPNANVYTSDGNFTSTRSVTDNTAWMLLCFKYDNSSLKLFNLTAGNAATGTATTGTRAPASKNMAISAYPSTSSTGTFDMAYCGIFNRYTSTDEDAAILAKLRVMMADRGITI